MDTQTNTLYKVRLWLGRWDAAVAAALQAAGIDVDRPPKTYRNEPVEVGLELMATSGLDTLAQVDAALKRAHLRRRLEDVTFDPYPIGGDRWGDGPPASDDDRPLFVRNPA